MRVMYLARYGRLGASSRVRGYQYLSHLSALGLQLSVAPFLSDAYLKARYSGGRIHLVDLFSVYARRLAMLFQKDRFDVLWVEYEALPWLPEWLEALLLRSKRPFLVDYDDAIFHRYDQHPNKWVRRWLGDKIDNVMRRAEVVTCGNEYLADRARHAGARRVEILPTVVDLDRYTNCEGALEQTSSNLLAIGWIGSPATSHYLELVHQSLKDVCSSDNVCLRLIGARDPCWSDVPYEVLPWSEGTEVALLASLDIGIMPLPDNPWERGKCGYKLVQYMASSKPVVASPVGVNRQLVSHGVNGFLAESKHQWVEALSSLLGDPSLRQRMGRAGRLRVERDYSVQVTTPRLAALLREAAQCGACVG